MRCLIKCLLCLYLCFYVARSFELKKPTVLVCMLARNKAHTLPFFLTLLQNQDYPKDRISLWIQSDHNQDETNEILRSWVSSVENLYHSVHTNLIEENVPFSEETSPGHWTLERFNHMIAMREEALNHARKLWADYVLAIDCDVFLTNPNTLNDLTTKNFTVVAPMLISEGLYSNFWHGWTEDYYYLRTEEYKPLLYRETTGCFPVPMVHSCVLINLKHAKSDILTYVPENINDYDGPRDDIIAFAISAMKGEVPLHVCNEIPYGYISLPLEQEDGLELDQQHLINVKLEALADGTTIAASDSFKKYVKQPKKDTVGFDKIYMINLLRRPERRKRMSACFDELGMNVTLFDAVDGKNLSGPLLEKISFLPEYADPYHKRPMTFGEIGCFLSHYNIWRQVAEMGYETVLVLEDDIRFEPFFRARLQNLMTEVRRLKDWDLVYLGRKRLEESDEPWIEGTSNLVRAGYSYWTLGYVLSQRGARKLLNGEPLKHLLPVDEYLPILFDKHPQTTWKNHFPRRDLVALSAAPLLLYPTHYTGEEGYVSDTEDSGIIRDVPGQAFGKEDL